MSHQWGWRSVLAGAVLLASSLRLWGADDPAKKTALDLLPASSMAYIEIAQPKRLLDDVLDHPLTKALEQQPGIKDAYDSPDVQQLLAGVKVFEDKLGQKWRPALGTLTGDGLYGTFDLATQGAILLVRAQDPKLLEKARDTFIELARAEARDKGDPDPVKMATYKDTPAYEVGEVKYAIVGPWLVLTNKNQLLQIVIDNAYAPGSRTLGKETQFAAAYKSKPEQATLWGYVDLTLLKATGVTRKASGVKSDNPALELLIGGVIEAAPDAPYVTASIHVDPSGLKVTSSIPYDAAKAGQTKAFYFGPAGSGAAPPLLEPKDTIVSLTTYRDFGLLWRSAPDLFDENINAQFAEAESNLTTLFSGRSFGDDILANLEPGMQLVVTRQHFGKDDVTPAIKLPALALVFRMKNPEETARQFKVTYQSLVGFANIAGGQAKLEPLEQDTEKIGGVTVVSATYVPPKDDQRQNAGIHFNASPTVAFVKDRFIFSSSKKLAVELGQQLEKSAAADEAGVNTRLRVSAAALRDVLADNHSQLVAQNMLEKGHDEAAAKAEVGTLLDLLKLVSESSMSLTTKDKTLTATWEIKFQK